MESPESVFKNNSSDIVKDLESLYERLKVVTQTIQTPEESLDQINNDVIETGANNDLTYPESDMRSPEATTNEGDCSCRKIFNSPNKKTCSLCGHNIPEIIQLVQEKLKFEDEVEVLDEIIKDERIEKERLESIRRDLEARIEKLEDELDDSCDKMDALKKDLNTINAKYIDEIEKLSEVQHSKALVEHELEELSKSLFEEANKMVSEEARNRHAAEQAKERLEDEVMNLKKQLFLQSNLNRDLKKKLKQSSPMLQSQDTDDNLQNLYNNSLDEDSVCDIDLKNIEEDEESLDELQLEQFETFAASCVNSPFPKILQHPFLKRCMEEDIEPCLKFGSNPRIYPRRVVDAILHDTLQILTANSAEEISPANSFKANSISPEASTEPEVNVSSPQSNSMGGMWSRWSNVAAQAISAANKISSSLPVKGCHACGQEATCPYRIQLVERQDPIPLDKFCKDKIVACQDFFNFISGIREGRFNTRRIDDLYTESLRLRLRMFYARLGFLPSFGIEIPRTLEYLSSPSLQLAPLLEEVEPPTSPR